MRKTLPKRGRPWHALEGHMVRMRAGDSDWRRGRLPYYVWSVVTITLFALEHSRADIARRRERWRSWQGHLDPQRLVFIDETWIKTNMTPLRGWGPKGQRARLCPAWPLAHHDLPWHLTLR
jgi:hypothetical protein